MNDFVWFLDQVTINRIKNEIIISGWAFDNSSGEALIPNVVENSNIVGTKLEIVQRMDVVASYYLDSNVKCGFVLTLTVINIRKRIQIVFQKGEKKEFVSIQPSLALVKEYLRKIKKYLKKGKKGRYYEFLRNKQYGEWIKNNENFSKEKDDEILKSLRNRPLISIIMPVYNVEEKWLTRCIRSVQNQYYPNWELCIADDASTNKGIKPLLERLKREDERIKVVFRERNGHISAASNSALSIASGEFVALLDNDDELAPNALFEAVKCINEHPDVDLVYSDEDKIDQNGHRSSAFFKSDWAPETLMATNYICHLGVYRKSIMDLIGGFRIGYEGAQDYDLVLRFTEKTDKICHIPKILYHWRILASSTAGGHGAKSYASDAGQRALQDALERRGRKGKVKKGISPGLYDVEYKINQEELVSVIIPTKNGYELLKRCLASIYENTDYSDFEVILVDNGSIEENTLQLLKEYDENHDNFYILRLDIPFNYAVLNNMAAEKAKGKYLLFLNNDTEILSSDWMTKMVSYAQFEDIGSVGAKLLYPDNTIQHSGIILGLCGIAGHGHYRWLNGEYGYFSKLVINTNYSAVTAACMMVKRKDFIDVNGFSQELGVAYNDVDLCLKLGEKKKRTVCLHDMVIYHHESASRGLEDTKDKRERFLQECEIFKEKWKEKIEKDPMYNSNLTKKNFDYQLRMEKTVNNKTDQIMV